jgi:hypothetical protein
VAHVGEARHDAARQLRLGHEPDGHLGRDREHAFAADQHAHQVEPGGVERLRAELDRLAFDRVAAHAQHVVDRQPVLQAVHAAGVLGHVAADRAGDLARRVGRVVQPVRRGGLADRDVAHAALHTRRARERIDRDDAVELREAQSRAEPVRQRAARQPGARTARDDRHVEPVAGAQHRGDLLFGLGQRDDERPLAIGGQPVALVRRRVLGLPQQRMGRQHAGQLGDDLRAPRRAVRLGVRGRPRGRWLDGWSVHVLSPMCGRPGLRPRPTLTLRRDRAARCDPAGRGRRVKSFRAA